MTLKKIFMLSPLAIAMSVGLYGCGERDNFPERPTKPTINSSSPVSLQTQHAEVNPNIKWLRDPVDFAAIQTDSDTVRKILLALQNNDFKTLQKIDDSGDIFCPDAQCLGAGQEPNEQTSRDMTALRKVVRENPGLATILGNYLESTGFEGQRDWAASWYQEGIKYGSLSSEEKLAGLSKKQPEYYRLLVEAFAGSDMVLTSPSADAQKAANYLREAVKLDGATDLGSFLPKLVSRNGANIASAVADVLIAPKSAPISAEAKSNAQKDCLEKGGNPESTTSGFAANNSSENANVEVTACSTLLETDRANFVAWENLAWALEKQRKTYLSMAAYARSAELGSSRGVIDYWRNKYQTSPEIAQQAIESESQAGNPWADLILVDIYSGAINPRLKDTKKMEEYLQRALSKGIPAAHYRQAQLLLERKEFDKAIESLKTSANFAYGPAMLQLGRMYQDGTGAKKNEESAIKWLKRAEQFGVMEAKPLIARIESSIEKKATPVEAKPASSGGMADKIVGTWLCPNEHGYISKEVIHKTGVIDIYQTPYVVGVAGTKIEYSGRWKIDGDILTTTIYPDQAYKIIRSDDVRVLQFRGSGTIQRCTRDF